VQDPFSQRPPTLAVQLDMEMRPLAIQQLSHGVNPVNQV
jgi:hypothetical protein